MFQSTFAVSLWSAFIGVVREGQGDHAPQISSIPCHFVLGEGLSPQKNTVARLKSKDLRPQKFCAGHATVYVEVLCDASPWREERWEQIRRVGACVRSRGDRSRAFWTPAPVLEKGDSCCSEAHWRFAFRKLKTEKKYFRIKFFSQLNPFLLNSLPRVFRAQSWCNS